MKWNPINFIDNILGILIYSCIFSVFIYPFFGISWKQISGSIILGFFASILNDIRRYLMEYTGNMDYSEEDYFDEKENPK